jgi:hypothetical protein
MLGRVPAHGAYRTVIGLTRMMFDGVDASSVPAGAAIYAGYVDGSWQSYGPLAQKFPHALHVSICVTASDNARVLDVETGDASPTQAPGWAAKQRAAGTAHPVVYMNESTWPAVRAAFADQGVTPPLYWVASYVSDPSNVPVIPSGAIAVQYYDYGGYDASRVADYWPGLDPVPSAGGSVLSEEDFVQIEPLSVHPGEYAFAFAPDKTELVLVADGYSSPGASLRVVVWAGNNANVHDAIVLGGTSGTHTYGIPLGAGATGVTIRREDAQGYPIGVAFQ